MKLYNYIVTMKKIKDSKFKLSCDQIKSLIFQPLSIGLYKYTSNNDEGEVIGERLQWNIDLANSIITLPWSKEELFYSVLVF